jgi:serine phosphatase RsbU (regulator of sigma subunit)
MAVPRLEVRDTLGEREVSLDQFPFSIGRRETNRLQLGGTEVSREHAEIVAQGDAFVLHDRDSRYGTFVNGEPVTQWQLKAGDVIRLGRGGGAELVFQMSEQASAKAAPPTGARDDLRQIAALLKGVRALGSGRVLQEVLALVLDSAIDISAAERGFIMLSAPDGKLEFRLGRGREKQTLSDSTFATSRKIPEEVFRTGETSVVTDLLDGDFAGGHMGTVALGIRNIVCVPLNYVHYVESAEAKADDRRIGVLYLDSRERGTLLSEATRTGLDTLAAEASVAIENARLYRANLEKARLEQEMRIAAEIQQALLPKPNASLDFVEAAAATIPCRSIGGDFFDYLNDTGSAFGFALGDVAGKGPPAALLSALMQGMFSAQGNPAGGPAVAVDLFNKALCRRGVEARFVTLMFGLVTPDGALTYCNAGHNPPIILSTGAIRHLEVGGPVIGLLSAARFEQGTDRLEKGDVIVIFSDGVSEAFSKVGEEFGESRLIQIVGDPTGVPAKDLVDRIVAGVRAITVGAVQSDDITVMVIRYLGPSA